MAPSSQNRNASSSSSSNDSSSSSFRDFELELEQRFTLTGRVTARADDLQIELQRIGKEMKRLTRAWMTSTYSSFSDASTSSPSSRRDIVGVEDSDFSGDGFDQDGFPMGKKYKNQSAAVPFTGVGALFELTVAPKRNLGWAAWNAVSNAACATRMAWRCLYSFPVRGVTTAPHSALPRAAGLLRGIGLGTAASAAFLTFGLVVSPITHLTLGAYNNLRGLRNMFTNDRTFDVYSGRYRPISLERERDQFLQTWKEEQMLLARGRRDHKRQKIRAEQIAKTFPMFKFMKDRLGALGGLGPAAATGDSTGTQGGHSLETDINNNYYALLQVAPDASTQQIKAAYRKLAMVLHPDIDGSAKARAEFERVTKAYQTLLDPQLRKAYDAGGAAFAESTKQHAAKAAAGAVDGMGGNVILKGSPMEVIQRIFGGVQFDLLIGPLYRSVWHMRAQGQSRLSMHTYEAVETMRMLRLSTILGSVLDVYAMSDEALTLFVSEELELIAPHLAKQLRDNIENLTVAAAAAAAACESKSAAKKPMGTSLPFSASSSSSSSSPSSAAKKNDAFGTSTAKNNVKGTKKKTTSSVGLFDVSVPTSPSTETPTNSSLPPLEPFTRRAHDFGSHLALKACFGRELLHEVGLCYIVNAQRYLGEVPVWKPRAVVQRKVAQGLGRLRKALTGTADPNDPTKMLSASDAAHFFAVEFDSAVCNLWMIVRFVCMTAVKDTSASQRVRLAISPPPVSSASPSASATSPPTPTLPGRQDADGSEAVTPMLLAQRLKGGNSNNNNNNTKSQQQRKLVLVQPRGPATPAMRQTIAIVCQLPQAEQQQLIQRVSVRVQEARAVALKELGRVFVQCGVPWSDLSLQQCVDQVRKHSANAATLPPPF